MTHLKETLFTQIFSSPLDLQLSILGQLSEEQLMNVALVNQQLLILCWDIRLARIKGWTKKEFIIFRLKLLLNRFQEDNKDIIVSNGCPIFYNGKHLIYLTLDNFIRMYVNVRRSKIFNLLKDKLNLELTKDSPFMKNYNDIFSKRNSGYSNYNFDPDMPSSMSQPIDLLLNVKRLSVSEPGHIKKIHDFSYFVGLENLRIFKESQIVRDNLPDCLETLSLDGNFLYVVEYLPPKLKSFNIDAVHGTARLDLKVQLPNTVIHLRSSCRNVQSISQFSTSLKTIEVCEYSYTHLKQLEKRLPKGIELIVVEDYQTFDLDF